ncbi:hypothetical protein SAMN03159423_4925 [Bradyrhizobium sp. NFR13]|uniref:hypothetical protein n=1 Tax=Bradyrhizobium sp. NFR13 TaxID=1566285 RepID=UPI0008F12851|nr:hypothetical protein [Bradyrhizobium sp. NFR13]SFM03020.1 hypothetical protein SAMN03159423_4925 [Bradyrhizobium sp. NFR13]
MIRLFAAALLCALSTTPAAAQNFLEGVVSINVTMTKEETCIASQYGVGDGHQGRRTAVLRPSDKGSGLSFRAFNRTGRAFRKVGKCY